MSVAGSTALLQDVLRRSAPFADWPAALLAPAVERFRLVTVLPGTQCCVEGQPGDEMYVVEAGQFAVDGSVGGERRRVAELGPGALFGEIAVLTGRPRTATITALTSGRLWALSRADFSDLVRLHPALGVTVGQLVSDRLADRARRRLANEKLSLFSLTTAKERITIGRTDEADVVIDDPLVSRLHAVLQRAGDEYRLVDMRSTNGVYVNGERIRTRLLREGDEIRIGSSAIIYDRSGLTHFSRGGGVQVDALGLSRVVGHGLTILRDVSLSIYPGELVCIVGGSGAGKTTLLNALSGFRPATGGKVLYDGEDYYLHFDAYRRALGYVPQDDIVHRELTVEQTLFSAARLRLPSDTGRGEVQTRINEVLAELELGERRNTVVAQLSGGQRKRVSIGVELLTRPDVFYLDEPTSGLDPGLDLRMMELLRNLANQGRTVILTTHATRNIMVCDKVVFMAPGGRLVFFGPPADALSHFGVSDFADIYRLLEGSEAPETWESRYRESDQYDRYVRQRLGSRSAERASNDESRPSRAKAPSAGPSWLTQLTWLSFRYLTILRRDWVSLVVLLTAAPIIAVLLASAFSRNVFAMTWADGGDARQAVALLFMLGSSSIFLGAFVAARSIADETPIFARERLVSLQIMPYILSKLGTLGLFSLIQSALLIVIISRRIEIPGGETTIFQLYLVLTLTNITAVGMGLLVSSLAANGLQATLIMVVLLVPQLILSGSVVPLEQLTAGAKVVSSVIIGRWSLSLLGHFTDVNARLNAQFPRNDYATQFDIDPLVYAVILFGLLVAFILAAAVALSRKRLR